MSNNVFLEGPIQTGKSTLIRRVLGSSISRCGGFASQRLVDFEGNILGFRIGPAESTPLNATVCYAGRQACPIIFPDGTTPDNVFKYWDPDGTPHVNTSVFSTTGVDYLKVLPDDRFMLLDEIGGVELTCDPFMDTLIDLLRSPVPCVGVLKLRSNVERIGDPAILSVYDELRQLILTEPDSRIIYHKRSF